ncbi:carboxymuconolactone decarboxylase family protein [Sediminicoccus sp. KRV36]|uniref:carboxymuconolactone decarboxylase family protein n=1 Tax=Sediminicoccus sp. KRV36 TaxID=3133721 RepID=UPI00200FB6CF|nr:carboxymuconolactone decarboxylase family protein [Sediminicoccus rosea]UPY37631.1 carboxymuconolactone decarboxylase family protein [Sediminicoccus rosea]
MSLESLRNALPEYAKDQKLNLGSLAAEPALTVQQRAGTFIVSALASRNATTTRAILAEFGPQLSAEALVAAKGAASIMGMNNIYYRFTHLVGGDYPSMPAKLRMNIMARPGVEKADFELWSLAVSAINGCGMCMESHEKVVKHAGLTSEQVQAAVRIASAVHAAAVTIEGEEALAA